MKAAGELEGKPFLERICAAPLAVNDERVTGALAGVRKAADASPDLAALLEQRPVSDLLAGVFSGSSYLSGLIERDIPRLQRILTRVPEAYFEELKGQLERDLDQATSRADAMRCLRVFKNEVALLTALADLAGVWDVMKVTAILTATGDAVVKDAIAYLFRQAAAGGQWLGKGADGAVAPSGYIVLAMGKYGAGELNYSSDIDLIVFYDLERIQLAPNVQPQPFFVRLTRDLVQLLEERTGDGYVFRTD